MKGKFHRKPLLFTAKNNSIKISIEKFCLFSHASLVKPGINPICVQFGKCPTKLHANTSIAHMSLDYISIVTAK